MLLKKIKVAKKTPKTILVYCSVVPHNFPPYHRLEFVKRLSKKFEILFIDLPTNTKPKTNLMTFYFSLFNFSNPNKDFFLWSHLENKRVNYFALNVFLLIQKYIFGKKVILYTTSGYFDRVYKHIPYDLSVFDCPDVHKNEFVNNKTWIKKFDLIFVNTEAVKSYVSKYNKNVNMVSSGYLTDSKLLSAKNKIPQSVLFLGGISQRIDYDAVYSLTRSLPRVNFFFAGDIYLNRYYAEKSDSKRLKKWESILKLKNCHYLGTLDKSNWQLIESFKVGIIPYIPNDTFNKFSNPIKIYEYLRARIPVISSYIYISNQLSNKIPILVYKNQKDLIRGVSRLLKSNYNFNEKGILKLLNDQSVDYKSKQVMQMLS